ncbi:hypothetical protein DAB59_16335 [Salmonella enterica]|nr:hypothetical protein [Salmonella enterica]
MSDSSKAESEFEKKGFWRGVIFAIADMVRGHGECVIAKDVLETLGGDLHSACRVSSEYDVLPLREVISDLPFGEDAEYVNLRTVPLDFNDKECTDADADYYEVREEYGNETVTVSRFNERSSAEEFISTNTMYLTENR